MLYNAAMRSSHVMIRLTKDEAADLERAASTALLAVSTWARVTLLTVARQGVGAGRTAKGRRYRARQPVNPPMEPASASEGAAGAQVSASQDPAVKGSKSRCSRHKRVGCTKDPECVRETTTFRA